MRKKTDNKTYISYLLILSILIIIFLVLFSYSLELSLTEISVENSIADVESETNQYEDVSVEISNEESNGEDESEEEKIVLESVSSQYTVIESDSIEELKSELAYCQENLSLAQSVIDAVMELGYDDTYSFIQIIYQDCKNYQSYINYYEEKINELNEIRYTQSLNEYPAATYIWYYMKKQGWSDYVCAGIMGNIMQETGGRTLNIDYTHSNTYYGMCCWKKEYHPKVVGLGLEGQCEYLVETLIEAMNNHGYLYQNGYTYEDFLEAESIEEAATAFMIVYERPGHTNSIKRVENGEKAYKYFVE